MEMVTLYKIKMSTAKFLDIVERIRVHSVCPFSLFFLCLGKSENEMRTQYLSLLSRAGFATDTSSGVPVLDLTREREFIILKMPMLLK